MKTTTRLGSGLVIVALIGFFCGILHGQSFDKLADADRTVFAKRFKTELWPLLSRNGKDGCVGCHDAGHQSSLHFTGDSEKDFRFLLKEGFFLYKDAGSLLDHVASNDPRVRMPFGNRPRWSKDEIKLLEEFTVAVHKKQKP